MPSPSVSVIIPAYNSSATIGSCLDSVFQQDSKDFEAIVVDDSSTDSTVEIVSKFNCTLIRQPQNRGPAAARNLGAKKANAPILLFVDADIVLPRNAVALTKKIFGENSSVAAFTGIYSLEHPHSSLFSQYKNLYFVYYTRQKPEKSHGLNSAIAGIRKNAFEKIGGFDEGISSLPLAEDVDLAMRLSAAGFTMLQSKTLEVKHLHKYTAAKVFRIDFMRGKVISKSLLKILFSGKKTKSAPTSISQFLSLYLSIPLSFLILLFAIAFLLYPDIFIISSLIILILIFVLLNAGFLLFILRKKGLLFSFSSAIITFLDRFAMGLGIAAGAAGFVLGDIK